MLAGMEAGVFALSRFRIRQQMRAGRATARLLQGFLDNPENFLWTILVGNTIANLLIFGWLVVLLHGLLGGHAGWFALAMAVLVFVFYMFFDLLPKMLFRAYPNRLCLFLARPFRVVHILLRPLVGLVESTSNALLRWRGGMTFTGKLFGSRDEFRQVMQESVQGLTSDERVMINRVLDLHGLSVQHAMRPLENMASLDADARMDDALALWRSQHLTRLPVWETRQGMRRIAGLLHMDDVIFGGEIDPARSVRDFLEPALFISADLRLEVGLRRMQRSGERLAVVLGRDQREIGIITLHDMLRIIFGEVNF